MARKIAGAWASKVRNASMFDDFYQVAITEMWLQIKSGKCPDNESRRDHLIEYARRAVRKLWRSHGNSSRVWSVDAFREKNEWEDFDFEEETPIPLEEVKVWYTSGPQIHKRLRFALDRIPPKYRVVLRSRYWEGQDVRTTAEATGIHENTVRTLEKKALEALRHEVAGDAIVRPDDGGEARSKVCTDCGEDKAFTEFPKGGCSDGLKSKCKECSARETRERKEKKRRERFAAVRHRAEGKSKECIDCREVKPLIEFEPHHKSKDGFGRRCQTCYRASIGPTGFRRKEGKGEMPGKRYCGKGGRCVMYRFLGHPVEISKSSESGLCGMCRTAAEDVA